MLRRLAENTSRENTPTSSNTETDRPAGNGADPDCPYCQGTGFLRVDRPLNDPLFGKLQICSCSAASAARYAYQRMYRMSNLQAFRHMTFDTFKVQGRLGLGDEQVASLTLAFNQAQNFANYLEGWLVLLGGYGTGKTHLAAAAANEALSRGIATFFLTVPDLLDWLRYSYDSPEQTYEERFEELRNAGLLVLDDLGTQNATPWAAEKLYQIINYRYVNRLPLIVTSNQALEEIDGRIQSRLRDPELVSLVRIHAPDFRSPTADSTQPRLSSLELYHRMQFGNFSLRDGEQLDAEERANLTRAYRLAQDYAENPRGWLVFSGAYGCGKTHLAASIGNYNRSLGHAPIFRSVPDLLDHLRSTFSPSSQASYDEVFEQVRSARLLILDDLDTRNASSWAREKLYQILNHRYMAELPTVITTANTLDATDERIRSRLLDTRLCTFFGILAPAYVTRAETRPQRARRR